MMQELNKLEFSILERLTIKYPFIKEHIPFLKVDTRENTGVGMYVNLVYDNSINSKINIDKKHTSVSTSETIKIDGLRHGLAYEVDIAEGKINFIELITYGEEWDGIVPDNFTFVPYHGARLLQN